MTGAIIFVICIVVAYALTPPSARRQNRNFPFK